MDNVDLNEKLAEWERFNNLDRPDVVLSRSKHLMKH